MMMSTTLDGRNAQEEFDGGGGGGRRVEENRRESEASGASGDVGFQIGGGSGGASFQLGVENSPDMNRELQFSLDNYPDYGGEDIDDFDLDPVYWESGENGEAMLMNGDFGGGEDGLLKIQRVDSKDVIFDTRPKKAKMLGKYIMCDILGEGSYAKVKEVIDSETLIRRAVKIMKRRKLRKIPHGEQNAEREIKLLKDLKHENVMSMTEVFYNEEKGKIYVVLEYCVGVLKDILDKVHNKKFPTWQAHHYFGQLMNGLEYLHSQRVIHKDIKPGNLLLNAAGILKIADLGVAEKLDLYSDPDKISTRGMGTPAFQPPEIANGLEVYPGYKLDVWSSGTTLYNFVTGEYPFEGETIYRLFEAIGRCEFDFPVGSNLDPVLQSLIRGMLTKDPHERLSVSQVISHDWLRKKHPASSPAIPELQLDAIPLISKTVIPFLSDLDFDWDAIPHDDNNDNRQEKTEFYKHEDEDIPHDLFEIQMGRFYVMKIIEDVPIPPPLPQHQQEETRNNCQKQDKEKTTKCLKVKKISGCCIA